MDRTQFLGGSDIGVVLGLSKYKTPLELWAEKTGRTEPEDISDKPAVLWGNRLERVVAQHFADTNGVEITQENRRVTDGFASAEVDFFIVDPDAILEIKTASLYLKSAWGEEGHINSNADSFIPPDYWVQLQWQLLLHGYDHGFFATLIGGQDYREYSAEADPETQDLIYKRAFEFWDLVKSDVPPRANPSDVSFLNKLYSVKKDSEIITNESVKHSVLEHLDAKADIKGFERTKDMAATSIKVFMGEHEALYDERNNLIATWREQERTKTDWPSVAKELTQYSKRAHNQFDRIVKKHTTTSTTRVLLTKEIRE